MSIADDVRSIVNSPKGITKSWYLNGLSAASYLCTGIDWDRYLRGLQKQAYNWQRATGVKRPREECFRFDEETGASHPVNESGAVEELLGPRPEGSPVSPAELSCNIWTSPFTLPTTVFKNTGQEQRKWS